MLHATTPERSLSLVVGVPSQAEVHEFDKLISLAADLEIGSYLLEPGSEVAGQLKVAQELSQDDTMPDVVYDGRSIELGIPQIDALAAHGVSSVIVSGQTRDIQKNLRSAGLNVIQQPNQLGNRKIELLHAVQTAFNAEGAIENRRRLFIPKELSVAAVASCVSHILNRSNSAINRISLYMENGADAETLDNMYIIPRHALRLHERILVAPSQADTSVSSVAAAAEQAQARYLRAA